MKPGCLGECLLLIGIFNLAAQAFVYKSWEQPVFTGEVIPLGVTSLRDAVSLVDSDI